MICSFATIYIKKSQINLIKTITKQFYEKDGGLLVWPTAGLHFDKNLIEKLQKKR